MSGGVNCENRIMREVGCRAETGTPLKVSSPTNGDRISDTIGDRDASGRWREKLVKTD